MRWLNDNLYLHGDIIMEQKSSGFPNHLIKEPWFLALSPSIQYYYLDGGGINQWDDKHYT